MKILILDRLDSAQLEPLLANNVVYRPDLLLKNPGMLGEALLALDIDAVISSAALPDAVLLQWSAARPAPVYWLRVAIGAAVAPPAMAAAPVVALTLAAESAQAAYIAAFEMLEREFSCRRLPPAPPLQAPRAAAGKRVLMVGAGLVNLITADALQREGYAVQLVDGGPDPREAAAWTAYGCSRGGDDARMFTLSEMDNYNDRELSSTMNSLFQRSVVDSGWNVHWKDTLSPEEQRWTAEFERIPAWLANRYNDDIFAFNRASKPLWERWISDDPELFAASMLREGILRLYSDADQYAGAVRRQQRIGAAKALLTPDEVGAGHPALAQAVRDGRIAGGIHAVGFTVNAHKFMHQLLDRLERAGVSFEWKQRAQNILFDTQNRVKGIRSTSRILQADHYVISPGAYGETLLAGTRSQGKIHGVLGAWLRLPNTDPQLRHSLKLARKGHITEDANITVATDTDGAPILIIGSGYGHTGVDPRNIDQALLHSIYQGLLDTAKQYFPQACEAAGQARLEASFKYCVRPWTASSLGLFESMATRSGGQCVITGGHNTGGFAQAPAIAQAVLASLDGRTHAMHHAYDPDRTAAFLGGTTAAAPRKRAEYAELN